MISPSIDTAAVRKWLNYCLAHFGSAKKASVRVDLLTNQHQVDAKRARASRVVLRIASLPV